MFLPVTKKEIKRLGWKDVDIILVTGDSYIDSPFIGAAVVGKVLLNAGFRVAVIAQPDIKSDKDIAELGEPRLFWGVTGGCVDSMVANRSASGKKRKRDDYTPGGLNTRRPDRAVIVYSNLIKARFKSSKPIVLGGLEASLRRIAHYDWWSDKIRRSILFDSKADYLLYGMAERSSVELADRLKNKKSPLNIRGLCHIAKEKPDNCLELPSFQEAAKDKEAFTRMFHLFYSHNDPLTASTLAQKHDSRYLIQNPPAFYLSQEELDSVHELEYRRDLHPFYRRDGEVNALNTIRFSITSHRGCYGECNFCAIAVHQGRTVRWRSKRSILAEAKKMTAHPKFKGIIRDVGGPTANMYGFECSQKLAEGACPKKRCLFPKVCSKLKIDHGKQISLLRELRRLKGARKVFVASGVRYDMVLADRKNGVEYLRELATHHVSGQLKIAPEHSQKNVLDKMGKPGGPELLTQFKRLFERLNREERRKQFLSYYIMAAHPGCEQRDMGKFKSFALSKLGILPRQIQVFTPSPSTYSSLMYLTETDPFSGKPCFVEKTFQGREKQKNMACVKREPDSKPALHNRPRGGFAQ